MKVRTTYHAEIARRETFLQIVASLEGRRKRVFRAILCYFPVTDKEIASITGIPINIVPARRKELQGYRWEHNPVTEKGEYVHHPELEYIVFDSYANDPLDKSIIEPGRRECRWRPTDQALKSQTELEFE